jgi:hypothetical protein
MQDAEAFLSGETCFGPGDEFDAVAGEHAILLHPSRTPSGFGAAGTDMIASMPASIAALSAVIRKSFISSPVMPH